MEAIILDRITQLEAEAYGILKAETVCMLLLILITVLLICVFITLLVIANRAKNLHKETIRLTREQEQATTALLKIVARNEQVDRKRKD